MSDNSETVEIHGHIIDSLSLPKVLDELIEAGADYEILEFNVGKSHQDPSYARIKIWTQTEEELERALRRIHPFGAAPLDIGEVTLEEVDIDGAFPASFYSTTNFPTEIRVGGRWIPVEHPEMDCGIAVEGTRAFTIPVADVKRGQMLVTGRDGIRVIPSERPRGKSALEFEFMGSSVSSEKPKELQVQRVASQMKAVKKEGQKILWVLGPAVIHTGSGPDLSALAANGWVDVVFAGNGFAAHDIESALFKTSLGVYLEEGTSAEGGHEHHIRAINTIRKAGSIAAAVDQGVLTGGIMHALVTRGRQFVLVGSVRDDGPLPDVYTDVIEGQRAMRAALPGVGFCVMVATTLHSVATGNILPASIPLVSVDINPATVTKLADRGSAQAVGIVTDIGLFLEGLARELVPGYTP